MLNSLAVGIAWSQEHSPILYVGQTVIHASDRRAGRIVLLGEYVAQISYGEGSTTKSVPVVELAYSGVVGRALELLSVHKDPVQVLFLLRREGLSNIRQTTQVS